MSPRQLHRYFEDNSMKTPHKWLHDLRMRRAVELMCDRTSVKAAALELEYKDVAHFSHDFTKYFGVPPSKFTFTETEPSHQTENVRF
jgi:AraC-like DNA-binding protein